MLSPIRRSICGRMMGLVGKRLIFITLPLSARAATCSTSDTERHALARRRLAPCGPPLPACAASCAAGRERARLGNLGAWRCGDGAAEQRVIGLAHPALQAIAQLGEHAAIG